MMSLEKILEQLAVEEVRGRTDRFVSDIQYDSRQVQEGDAFVAIRGYRTDGHRFLSQAYQQGARVFFVEEAQELPDATMVVVRDTRATLAKIASIFFNEPARKLKVVGITGTNGKTTTAYLIHSILQAAHWKPGLISTIRTFDGKEWQEAERTTPESVDIQRLMARMVRSGARSCVMEVSSHALVLHRVDEIPFLAAVFTNLSRDHLDFHGTVEEYFRAKLRLFKNLTEHQYAIVNLDDPYGQRVIEATSGEIFTYSMHIPQATVKYLSHQIFPGGMEIRLRIPEGEIQLETSLVGKFNIYNVMAAVTTAVALGIQSSFIGKGIRQLQRVPGRCEVFNLPGGATAYVDYAHTPDALVNILKAVWETQPRNLIVVFGAGGDRDPGKRPMMGKAAEDFADVIILTNDNPRSEDPGKIIEDILEGIYEREKVTVIPDRREAIWKALQMAGKHDAVVIAGKGHETYQIIGNRSFPFDDRQVVKEFIQSKQRRDSAEKT